MFEVAKAGRFLSKVVASIRARGLLPTVGRAAEKLDIAVGARWFDLRHGTDTAGVVPLSRLRIESPHAPDGVHYEAIPARQFRRVMSLLALPKEAAFVDMGCGKGKALLLACEYGFRRVIGVEFSAELCEVARRNLAVHALRTGCSTDAHVVHGDVVDYAIWDESVFFLYNPFNAFVLRALVTNIERSMRQHPRDVWLVYFLPVHHAAAIGPPFVMARHLDVFGVDGGVNVYAASGAAARRDPAGPRPSRSPGRGGPPPTYREPREPPSRRS